MISSSKINITRSSTPSSIPSFTSLSLSLSSSPSSSSYHSSSYPSHTAPSINHPHFNTNPLMTHVYPVSSSDFYLNSFSPIISFEHEQRSRQPQQQQHHHDYSINRYDELGIIGKGAFAIVKLVKRKDDESQVYAMKILRKKEVMKRNQVTHVKKYVFKYHIFIFIY